MFLQQLLHTNDPDVPRFNYPVLSNDWRACQTQTAGLHWESIEPGLPGLLNKAHSIATREGIPALVTITFQGVKYTYFLAGFFW